MEGREVFRNGDWSVEMRKRNNHPGEKSWILFNGVEAFSYNGESFRSRHYVMKDICCVPDLIRKKAVEAFESQ